MEDDYLFTRDSLDNGVVVLGEFRLVSDKVLRLLSVLVTHFSTLQRIVYRGDFFCERFPILFIFFN